MELSRLRPGTRFVLLRTGERFRFLGRRDKPQGFRADVVQASDGRVTSLSGQCHVMPIVKPRIKAKATISNLETV